MKVRHLIQNIIDSMENPTLEDVWRHLIAYVAVAGAKIDITRDCVEEYLRGKND